MTQASESSGMELGGKEKSTGKTSINRKKKKSPYILPSGFNKSKTQLALKVQYVSRHCGKKRQSLEKGAHGTRGRPAGGLQRLQRGWRTAGTTWKRHMVPAPTQRFCVKCKLFQLSRSQIALFFLVGWSNMRLGLALYRFQRAPREGKRSRQ